MTNDLAQEEQHATFEDFAEAVIGKLQNDLRSTPNDEMKKQNLTLSAKRTLNDNIFDGTR